MPIKNFKFFEKSFYKEGFFDKKVYEAYWNDDDNENDDEWASSDYWNDQYSDMYSKINTDRLHDIGLMEYSDIVKNAIYHFEKKISLKTYQNVIPEKDVIKEYIIDIIGDNYLDYIPILKLNKLSEYIHSEIENYIYN